MLLHPRTKMQEWEIYFRPRIDTVKLGFEFFRTVDLYFWDEYESHDKGVRGLQFDILDKIEHLQTMITRRDVKELPNVAPSHLTVLLPSPYYGRDWQAVEHLLDFSR
jgi:hypothetical protein